MTREEGEEEEVEGRSTEAVVAVEGGGRGMLEEREATQLRPKRTYHWIDKLWCVFFPLDKIIWKGEGRKKVAAQI